MHDKETVELALLGLSEGMSVTEVARDLGIHKATVSRWGSGRLPHSATGKPVDSSRGDRAAGRRKAVGEEGGGARGGRAPRYLGDDGGGAQGARPRLRAGRGDTRAGGRDTKKGPGAGPETLTSGEKAAVAGALRGRFGLRGVLRRLGLARSTFFYHEARRSAPGASTPSGAAGRAPLRGRAARPRSTRRGPWSSRRRWCAG